MFHLRSTPIQSPLTTLIIGSLFALAFHGWSMIAHADIDVSKLPKAAERKVDYTEDIQPLLAARCVKCHGTDKQSADLRLDTRTATLKGGQSGPAVIVGKSAESLLVVAASQLDDGLAMPPEGEPLSAAEVGLLRAWIDQGAKGPDDTAAAARPIPWSFRPIARPDLASAESIDELVSRKLDDQKLHRSPTADRRMLIRRLYLVMHGLPPTPAEVDKFVRDERPNAYAELVEQVLASPRYGERWARHWLDVVRFAESHGFETNRVRQNAWPYRDYVIQSFNEDRPYNQFVKEQIAGDALGADVATGFLVAGPTDLVKSPDINLTLMQRQDELADLINTTGTAFLGLTLGCARCHDHKFDPISQRDYYGLQAIFAGVQFGSRTLTRKLSPSEERNVADVKRDLADCRAQWEALREVGRKAANGNQKLRVAVNERLNEEHFEPVTTKSIRLTILATNSSEPCLDELEIYDDARNNVALQSTGAKPAASSTLPGYEIHKLEHLNDGRTGNERSWISNEVAGSWVRIDFPDPRRIERIVWGRDRSGKFKDRIPTRYRFDVLRGADEWVVVASSDDREQFNSQDPDAYLKYLSPNDAARAKQLKTRQLELESKLQATAVEIPAWLGTFNQPEPTRRLHRGDHTQPREVIAPQTIDVPGVAGFPASFHLDVNSPEQQRRVKLAEWIADPTNPLTPRVMVNRIWHYIFGTGIVETPSDFGANGVPPSNALLLDWLADEFVRSGWSIKHIQRLILQSQTFQQASLPRDDGLKIDAAARLLWRFPPRRLEGEAIRDCILSASGALNSQMGGPGFFLQVVEVDNVYRYFPKEEFGPEEFRRMVYLNRVRQEQDSIFGSFDCPSGNQVTPRRPRSNTPLQALNLFNSPFVLQQSKIFADRLRREAGDDVEAQVRIAYRLTTAREPDRFELDACRELIQDAGLDAFCRALFNTSEFLFIF